MLFRIVVKAIPDLNGLFAPLKPGVGVYGCSPHQSFPSLGRHPSIIKNRSLYQYFTVITHEPQGPPVPSEHV